MSVRRAAITHLIKSEMRLGEMAQRREMPVAEVEKMAIASLSILNQSPEEVATTLNLDIQAVQAALEKAE